MPRILITGAASGIGAGLATELARAGHHIIVSDLQQRDCQEFVLRMRHAQLDRVARVTQRFEQLRRRLESRDVRRVTANWQLRLATMDGRLRQIGERQVQAADGRTRELAARLNALSPLAVLGRGYAVCWNDARTSIIRSASSVSKGDAVRVTVAEGELRCEVTETNDVRNGMKARNGMNER